MNEYSLQIGKFLGTLFQEYTLFVLLFIGWVVAIIGVFWLIKRRKNEISNR